MNTRIHDVPASLVEAIEIDAERYNLIRLALLRLGSPLRIPLTGLRNLDILLDKESWVCVDRSALDMPVAAWVQFDDYDRNHLQAPVGCQLRHYQNNTDILLPYVWMTLESSLYQQLYSQREPGAAIVVPFARISA